MFNVLIAVDDDSAKDTIVDFVCKHNWADDTRFRILTIGPWMPPESQVRGSKDLQQWLEASINSRKALLESVAGSIRTGLCKRIGNFDLETTMLQGVPCDLILEVLESWPANLVLVGSNGRKGLDLFMLGSVSNSVVTNACCSVLVIKPGTDLLKHTSRALTGKNKVSK